MESSTRLKKTFGIFAPLLLIVCSSLADPLDTPYWKTFHINVLGVNGGIETAEYRELMLANTGGIMPRNLMV